MPMKLLTDDAFRAELKAGRAAPDGTLFKFATTEPATVGDAAARTKRFVFSDATVDHAGDSIDPKGWNLSVFKRNPVALFSHMSWDPPIGRASNVKVQDGQLVGDIEFASADVYDFADTIFRLVDGGYLKAVSVGFKPDEYVFTNDKNRPYGIDFTKQTLLEISVCPVPCNPNALGEARGAGVDTAPLCDWAEKVLDTGDVVFLPRKDLETLRTQAKGSAPPLFYFEASRALKATEAARISEAAKSYRDDPTATLILPEGVTLRTVEPEPTEFDSEAEAAAVEAAVEDAVKAPSLDLIRRVASLALKAGRRISAATRAKMQAALDMSAAHHDAMTKCITEAMGDPDADDGTDPDEAQTDAAIPAQPLGSVVQDDAHDLTTREGRLKHVRALKESLPKND